MFSMCLIFEFYNNWFTLFDNVILNFFDDFDLNWMLNLKLVMFVSKLFSNNILSVLVRCLKQRIFMILNNVVIRYFYSLYVLNVWYWFLMFNKTWLLCCKKFDFVVSIEKLERLSTKISFNNFLSQNDHQKMKFSAIRKDCTIEH